MAQCTHSLHVRAILSSRWWMPPRGTLVLGWLLVCQPANLQALDWPAMLRKVDYLAVDHAMVADHHDAFGQSFY